MRIYKTKKGYFYKEYKNGKKKRISKKEYLKIKRENVYGNKQKGGNQQYVYVEDANPDGVIVRDDSSFSSDVRNTKIFQKGDKINVTAVQRVLRQTGRPTLRLQFKDGWVSKNRSNGAQIFKLVDEYNNYLKMRRGMFSTNILNLRTDQLKSIKEYLHTKKSATNEYNAKISSLNEQIAQKMVTNLKTFKTNVRYDIPTGTFYESSSLLYRKPDNLFSSSDEEEN